MFTSSVSTVVCLAFCALCAFSIKAENHQVADGQLDDAALVGLVPASDFVASEDEYNDESSVRRVLIDIEPMDEEKRAMPGVMRFGKRGDMPGVLRFGKRAMPGVMRFGKKAMPGVMRFGKKSMPGVMRFGKRMVADDQDIEKRKAGPAPIRFG